MSIEDWCEQRKIQSPQFQYWHLVLKMEIDILVFIRSLRESNFNLYRQALCQLIPYMFANNNVNYARWLPIHLLDMLTLEERHPSIAEAFHAGKFVVHKTERNFSGLAIDQAHEQANAVIKGDGGAVGITEDPSALRRWMTAGPAVSQLVAQYEEVSVIRDVSKQNKHHEQTPGYQKDFLDKVKNLDKHTRANGQPI